MKTLHGSSTFKAGGNVVGRIEYTRVFVKESIPRSWNGIGVLEPDMDANVLLDGGYLDFELQEDDKIHTGTVLIKTESMDSRGHYQIEFQGSGPLTTTSSTE